VFVLHYSVDFNKLNDDDDELDDHEVNLPVATVQVRVQVFFVGSLLLDFSYRKWIKRRGNIFWY